MIFKLRDDWWYVSSVGKKYSKKMIFISGSDTFHGEQHERNKGRSSNICRWKRDLQHAQFTFVIFKHPEFQIQSTADCCHGDLSSRHWSQMWPEDKPHGELNHMISSFYQKSDMLLIKICSTELMSLVVLFLRKWTVYGKYSRIYLTQHAF